MTTEGREDKDGMDRQDDEALWSLLGRSAPPVQPSPYFSRRVLREVTLAEEARAAGWWSRFSHGFAGAAIFRRTALWSGAFSGVCALGLFCLSLGTRLPGEHSSPTRRGKTVAASASPQPAGTPLAAVQTNANAVATGQDSVPVHEVEVIADLDNILEREESRLWTEETARF